MDLVRLVWSCGPEGMIRLQIETNTDHALSRPTIQHSLPPATTVNLLSLLVLISRILILLLPFEGIYSRCFCSDYVIHNVMSGLA